MHAGLRLNLMVTLAVAACDAPTREEVAGLQQRLDSLAAEQTALRTASDGAKAELAKRGEADAAHDAALAAAQTETIALREALTAAEARIPVAPPTPLPVAGKPDPAARYRVTLGDSEFEGPADAKVTVVIFSDFQCPFCARVQPTLDEVRKAYAADVRIVAKHNPLSFHPNAEPAARAALAAGKQGKYWEMHDQLYTDTKALSQTDLEGYAKALGLDLAQFRRDMDDKAIVERIAADQRQAAELGARGTPSFFVNGRYVAGAQPLASFKTLIDAEIAEADRRIASGTPRAGLYEALMASATPGVGTP